MHLKSKPSARNFLFLSYFLLIFFSLLKTFFFFLQNRIQRLYDSFKLKKCFHFNIYIQMSVALVSSAFMNCFIEKIEECCVKAARFWPQYTQASLSTQVLGMLIIWTFWFRAVSLFTMRKIIIMFPHFCINSFLSQTWVCDIGRKLLENQNKLQPLVPHCPHLYSIKEFLQIDRGMIYT